MADLTITADNVLDDQAGSTNDPVMIDSSHLAGATITAGEVVYLDANNLVQLAQATTATLAQAYGVCLSNQSYAGQPVIIQTGGPITIGATVAVGVTYCVSSANPGGIAPEADLANPNYKTYLGIGISVTDILLQINPTGIVVA